MSSPCGCSERPASQSSICRNLGDDPIELCERRGASEIVQSRSFTSTLYTTAKGGSLSYVGVKLYVVCIQYHARRLKIVGCHARVISTIKADLRPFGPAVSVTRVTIPATHSPNLKLRTNQGSPELLKLIACNTRLLSLDRTVFSDLLVTAPNMTG